MEFRCPYGCDDFFYECPEGVKVNSYNITGKVDEVMSGFVFSLRNKQQCNFKVLMH